MNWTKIVVLITAFAVMLIYASPVSAWKKTPPKPINVSAIADSVTGSAKQSQVI